MTPASPADGRAAKNLVRLELSMAVNVNASTRHLTVRAIRAVGVEVPMTYALGTSRGTITKAPLLLVDLETEEGVTGRSYLWCYFRAAMPAIANILEEVERVLKGDRVAPVDLWDKLAQRFALIGVQGIVRMAM